MKDKLNKLLLLLPIGLIKFYRYFISPILPNNCRYLPTCSDYSLESYRKYGLISGSILSAKRLLSCHPFSKSGFDPVNDNHKKILF